MSEAALAWGFYEHFVDAKGRLVWPQELRDPLGQEFVLTRGMDATILALPMSEWQKIENRLAEGIFDREAILLQRMLGGRVVTSLDREARLQLPKHLRDSSGFGHATTAVIVGMGRKVEIWEKGKWDEYQRGVPVDNMYGATASLGFDEQLRHGSGVPQASPA